MSEERVVLKENSRYPVYCNDCQSVREGVFHESSANSSPVWLRCGKCGLFNVIAPFHRYGELNGYGALFADLYLSVEEARAVVMGWDATFHARGLAVIRQVECGA